MKKVEKNEQAGAEWNGPDVCRCQCLAGGACERKICTGACELMREEVANV
jgi:hypothetical protein